MRATMHAARRQGASEERCQPQPRIQKQIVSLFAEGRREEDKPATSVHTVKTPAERAAGRNPYAVTSIASPLAKDAVARGPVVTRFCRASSVAAEDRCRR